ncbi:MAG TPA: molecular chaperone HtpG [Brevefilum fermentans]|jgi:molecular chaperone HtpG|nr:molecular chaperone HtpG [Brevefilum fermentans]HQA28622.1 molecular chaperone HtpG [Brevefilum fermentans]
MPEVSKPAKNQPIPFKAETQQLLNILIHSLYTEREIFLRELISNASDALARLDFIMLTDRDVHDPDLPTEIRIRADKDAGILIVEDTGIGMTHDELIENLGTIAHSGARAFVEAAQTSQASLTEIIGQFGVGFYAAFMVADSIRVVSRSYRQDAQSAAWQAAGEDTYTLAPGDRDKRGTEVRITLKEDAREFLDETRLRQVIKRHSDFIQYPIYINDEDAPVNRQTALWRQSPRTVESDAYSEFYKQLTLDFSDPLVHAHMVVDAPVQMYALLYIPADPRNLVFSPRKEPGLKLYARNVLIQDFSIDLLPLYLGFVQGVVDSEDLPLNVSREMVQSSNVMARLKRLVTGKVLETLTDLGRTDPDQYLKFWETYGGFIKEGVAIEQDEPEKLFPLLRFHTDRDPSGWSSLEDVLARAKPGQKEIYYFLGEDASAVRYSPHMDVFRSAGIEVLVLADQVDPFMLMQLKAFQEHPLVNVAAAEPPQIEKETREDDAEPVLDQAALADLIVRFKSLLGERVSAVRVSTRLSASPARLVDPEGAPDQSVQRVYQMMDKDFELPKKVLELNPKHPIIARLSALRPADPKFDLAAEQIFENALLVEGLHPDPVSMVGRIQELIARALGDVEES